MVFSQTGFQIHKIIIAQNYAHFKMSLEFGGEGLFVQKYSHTYFKNSQFGMLWFIIYL